MRTLHPTPYTLHPRRLRRRCAGFTLIEAALTTVIVGTGVLAIVAAQQAYHQKNGWAQRTGTAMLLANEMRELTAMMPLSDPQGGGLIGVEPNELDADGDPDLELFDDLDDFAGTIDAGGEGAGMTFDPPINAMRDPIDDMDGWSQHIQIKKVPASNISTTLTYPVATADDVLIDGLPLLTRVTVTVLYQGPYDDEPRAATRLTWVATEN